MTALSATLSRALHRPLHRFRGLPVADLPRRFAPHLQAVQEALGLPIVVARFAVARSARIVAMSLRPRLRPRRLPLPSRPVANLSVLHVPRSIALLLTRWTRLLRLLLEPTAPPVAVVVAVMPVGLAPRQGGGDESDQEGEEPRDNRLGARWHGKGSASSGPQGPRIVA